MSNSHTDYSGRKKRTPPLLAREWGIGVDKIRTLIRAGELRAIDVSTQRGGRPRYLIGLEDIADFEARRAVTAAPPRPARRRRRTTDLIEFF